MELIQNLEPIKDLEPTQLRELMGTIQHEEMRKNQKLESYDERNWFVYLVEGELKLRAPKAREQRFGSESDRAYQPLFTDPNSHEIAVFMAKSMVIRIDRKRYTQLSESSGVVDVTDIQVGEAEAEIVRRLFIDYQNNAIPVPSIPEVALRVRELMQDPDVDQRHLAAAIENDPAMAGKLIAAANSALVRGRMEICEVHQALVRMGLKSATSLVISAAMRDLFQFSDPQLRLVAKEVWNHAVRVGAIARVLAPQWNGTAPLERDKAFMLGLLHNIGAASLLAYFERLDSGVSRIAIYATLEKLQKLVSTLVLEKWRLDDDFIKVAGEAGDFETTHQLDYVNLISLSVHQAQCLSELWDNLPRVDTLPGFRMLTADTSVNAEGLLESLEDNAEIGALTQLLDR